VQGNSSRISPYTRTPTLIYHCRLITSSHALPSTFSLSERGKGEREWEMGKDEGHNNRTVY
jgi:hypothetical protein